MKKQLLLSIFLIICVLTVSAQDKLSYEKGDQLLKFGFGLGSSFSTGSVKVPPIQAVYEYGLTEEISIGGIAGYASTSIDQINVNYLIIGGRANYHFESSGKFDPYGGGTLGYYKGSIKTGNAYLGDYNLSSPIFGAQLGANYYFKPNLGAWAEVGYGIGYLNLGVVFKF